MKNLLVLSVTVLVMSFCGTCFGIATNPDPPNGIMGIPVTNVTLGWTSSADNFDVLFGMDPFALPFLDNVSAMTYDLPTLSIDTTYYWRIDEYKNDVVYQGDIWSFTTVPEPTTLLLLGLGGVLIRKWRG